MSIIDNKAYRSIIIFMIPVILASVIGVFTWFDAEINSIESVALENKAELAKREYAVSLVPQIHENTIIICNSLDVSCK